MGKETAEQKLLKLIETPSGDPKAPGQEAAQQVAQAVGGHGFMGLAIPSFLRSFHFSFGLREINKILLVVIVAVFAALILDVLRGMKSLEKKVDLAVDSTAAKTTLNILLPAKDLNDYLSLADNRNIFQPVEKKTVEQKIATAQTANEKMALRTEKLKLVGVSWQDSPETASAMIEDTETGMTYFVHQGERVKEFTVKGIYADGVVLNFEGEEITIRL